MISGVHAIIFSRDADAVRAFLRDVLELPSVDAGEGGPSSRSRPQSWQPIRRTMLVITSSTSCAMTSKRPSGSSSASASRSANPSARNGGGGWLPSGCPTATNSASISRITQLRRTAQTANSRTVGTRHRPRDNGRVRRLRGRPPARYEVTGCARWSLIWTGSHSKEGCGQQRRSSEPLMRSSIRTVTRWFGRRPCRRTPVHVARVPCFSIRQTVPYRRSRASVAGGNGMLCTSRATSCPDQWCGYVRHGPSVCGWTQPPAPLRPQPDDHAHSNAPTNSDSTFTTSGTHRTDEKFRPRRRAGAATTRVAFGRPPRQGYADRGETDGVVMSFPYPRH